MSVEGVEGESLHAALEELAVASGSACTSLTDEPSYVLRVLGRSPPWPAAPCASPSAGPTTAEEIDRAAEVFAGAVAELRATVARHAGRRRADAGRASLPAPCWRAARRAPMEAGTWVVFTARVRDGRVARLDARVYGCPHTRAACDRVGPAADRRHRCRNWAAWSPWPLGADLGIPPEKAGRLLIIQDALRNCLADWDNGQLKPAP